MRNKIYTEPQCAPTKVCECCGKSFTPLKIDERIRYCSKKCQRKGNRKGLHESTKTDDLKGVNYVKRYAPGWKYIGGFANSESRLTVQCETCGTVTVRSAQAIRKYSTVCEVCKAEKAKQNEEAKAERIRLEDEHKRIKKEIRDFNRPVKKYKQVKAKSCLMCGGFFIGTGKYCSDECRTQALNHYYSLKKEKRRRSSFTKDSRAISVKSVYERDNGVCWLCGGLCDINADPNSNEYPSVDHVLPISLGGMDEWGNVRLAHRYCNSLRGNRHI